MNNLIDKIYDESAKQKVHSLPRIEQIKLYIELYEKFKEENIALS
jgi:hypothetical protein